MLMRSLYFLYVSPIFISLFFSKKKLLKAEIRTNGGFSVGESGTARGRLCGWLEQKTILRLVGTKHHLRLPCATEGPPGWGPKMGRNEHSAHVPPQGGVPGDWNSPLGGLSSSNSNLYKATCFTGSVARQREGQVGTKNHPARIVSHQHSGVKQPGRDKRKKRLHLIKRLKSINPSKFCLTHIRKTKNNIHCVLSTVFGQQKTLWSISGGQVNASSRSRNNGRRKTRFTQRMVFKSLVEKILGMGFAYVVIHCSGLLSSKRKIFKTFSQHFNVVLVKDLTNIAHNGCRAPKKRRV